MNMKKMKYILLVSLAVSINNFLNAQENANPSDTLAKAVESLQSDIKIHNRLKISGYIQAQWQKSDTIGSPGKYSGGDFIGYDNRFQVRRGRFKTEYSNELSQYVIQIDVTEKAVSIKDAYVAFTDPCLKTFTLTGGAFNRPFGYEVSYSSASLESPERSRVAQALFPNEEDLGAQLAIQAPSSSPFNFIKLQGGLFTGNGLNPETDKYKDFIGQIILKKTFMNEHLLLSGGASYYNGGIAAYSPAIDYNSSKYAYYYHTITNGFYIKDSIKAGAKLKREYIGLDLQASLHSDLGITTLRVEYIIGTQPGFPNNKGTNVNYSPSNDQPVAANASYVTAVVKDTSGKLNTINTTKQLDVVPLNYFSRSFTGGYVYLIQSILQTKHELVLKYDWYDPNTKISGNKIGVAKSNTGTADIKFSTIGIGWIYHWNSNVKLTAYYEIVSNEKASVPLTSKGINGTNNYTKELKDNVLTLRVQYKF
jgi:hypothetical protein